MIYIFNIAICDDELNFLNRLSSLLKELFLKNGFIPIIEEFRESSRLIGKIEKEKKIYDIIFLDVEMPRMDGFLVAEKLRQIDKNFTLIFVTCMESYVKKAFEYSAFGYIYKNSLNEELSPLIEKIFIKQYDSILNKKTISFNTKEDGESYTISVYEKDIIELYIFNRRIHLKTIHSNYSLLKYSLNYYKNIINSENFIIISRSNLINLLHVKELRGDFFILSDDKSVCIGSTRDKINEVKMKYAIFKNERI